MNDLTVFNSEEFGEVRTAIINDEPYFCLADVCKCLDLENTSQVKTRLDIDGVISNEVIDNLGRRQEATFINEPNLYKVIFQSKKPCAEKFQNWVYKEVLPQIRKTGGYSIVPKTLKEALFFAYKQQEELEEKQKEIEYLEKTKAWISDKKTATAMNTASQKVKENNQLRMELDRSKEYATVKKVEINTGVRFKWKPLREYFNKHNLPTGKVFDQNYGTVKTYPSKAWKDVYNIDILEFD